MLVLLKLIPWKVWAGLVLSLIMAGGLFTCNRQAEQRGADAIRTEIQEQDRGAADAAEKARGVRRACVDGGGVWDTSTGKCGQR